jgi:hypothetical protein
MSEVLPENTNNIGEAKPMNAIDTPVTDENSALNVLVAFLGVAQSRGVFAINEAAKIYECIQMFQKKSNEEKSTE